MSPTLFLLLVLLSAEAAEDLQCLKPGPGEPAASSLFYSHLQRQAYQALDRRQAAYEELKTPEQVAAYQQRMRALFIEQLGGFPPRTPLNAQVVGKIPAAGYHIEKIIFENQPKHPVTGTLYIPDTKPPHPVVLVSSGHSRTAKAADYNQKIAIALA